MTPENMSGYNVSLHVVYKDHYYDLTEKFFKEPKPTFCLLVAFLNLFTVFYSSFLPTDPPITLSYAVGVVLSGGSRFFFTC